mmetsp:Transcript_124762/g.216298  ORF Transcript_124762/g.216298 Transcript_124762/m.216298 type:complete len:222 (+) Transcript_124762:72-737(+)
MMSAATFDMRSVWYCWMALRILGRKKRALNLEKTRNISVAVPARARRSRSLLVMCLSTLSIRSSYWRRLISQSWELLSVMSTTISFLSLTSAYAWFTSSVELIPPAAASPSSAGITRLRTVRKLSCWRRKARICSIRVLRGRCSFRESFSGICCVRRFASCWQSFKYCRCWCCHRANRSAQPLVAFSKSSNGRCNSCCPAKILATCCVNSCVIESISQMTR